MMTRIGITAGEIYNKVQSWSPVTYGQSKTYCDAVMQAGGVPFVLPITDDPKVLRAMYDAVDGLLLAGGNDVDPQLYGENSLHTTKDVSPLRDNYETQLITWALADKKPILAICRGMHLVNVIQGGTLYQDIPTQLPNAEDHNSSTAKKDLEHLAHNLRLKPGSKLANILQTPQIKTNTHHHQAVKQLGSNLQAVAWAEDDIIEAIESEDESYIIGVQSHPESLVMRAQEQWLRMFKSFVQAARKSTK